MGTGVHWDVWVNVGHDDPPQLLDKVTLLVRFLVPLFVLHLPGGAEHDPQADQLLTWMKKKKKYLKQNKWTTPLGHLYWKDTSIQGKGHYFWVQTPGFNLPFGDTLVGTKRVTDHKEG